jgi:serine/threonine-protein kinase SMG1
MIDFFTGCLQMACAFKGKGDRLPDNHFERTTGSFKKLLADYVRHMVLGIGPQYFALAIGGILENVAAQSADVAIAEIGGGDLVSLFELCHQVYEIAVKRNDLSVHGITQSTYHCGALKDAWWRKENVIYWENTIKLQTIEIQRIHQLLSAFYWINEDLIVQNQQHQMMQLCPIDRESMLLQLRNAVQSLSGWKATVQKIRDELQNISVAVIQRLKWAAGANPGLVELQIAFEQLTLAKREKIDKECLLAAVALKYCISTLNFELLRIKSIDSSKLDTDFVALAARWEKACQAHKTCATIIAPVEKALVELLDPEGPINANWLKNVSDLLDDMTDHAQQEISRCEKDITVSQDCLQMSAHMLRDTVAKHHGLANHVKTLLKSTQKVEDTMTDQIKGYLGRYKEFMDTIAELNGNVLSQDFTESVVRQTLALLADVLDRMSDMFENLFVFEKWLKERPEAAPLRSSALDKRVGEMMATEKESSEVVMSPQRKRGECT